jgi:hypothetical protein
MTLLPREIMNYVSDLPYPARLVGCRATSSNSNDGSSLSHPCCEYDIVVFGKGQNKIEKIGNHVIELVYISGSPREHIVTLKGMPILHKDSALALSQSSALKEIIEDKEEQERRFKKALYATGRKALVNSLFCQQRFRQAKEIRTSAMWLKIASYHLIAGTLAIFGTRPMPVHELAQTRQTDLTADAADGIQAALECIGIERATRPAIRRSIEAVLELKLSDYDRLLVRDKMQYLLEKSMLADCYYYAGRVAFESLASRNDSFFARYGKLVQIAMDLSVDSQRLQKLQKSLASAAKKGLKLYSNSTNSFSQ